MENCTLVSSFVFGYLAILMKYLSLLLALVIPLLSSCAPWTPAQKQKAVAIGTKVGGVALDILQVVTNTAVQVVVAKATSTQDLTDKGNLLDSAAAGLRSLQGQTNNIITPATVAATVTQFTDPNKTHWDTLATSLAGNFAASPAATDVTLEAMAQGLNSAAVTARTTAAAPTTP